MPIYSYKCLNCNHLFEELVKLDSPNPPCEKCKKETEKKMSLSSFTLKGSGWAKDGYS